MTKLRITQIVSANGETKRQKENLRALAIHRMKETVEVEKCPVALGQVAEVHHLVKVEEI